MSRTYRRTGGNQWWHNYIIARWKKDPERGGRGRNPHESFELTLERELARYHSDAGWAYGHTPSWWILQEMTVPQRQEVRRLIHKVHRLPLEDAGELMFPLAKKPHDYYW